MLKNSDDDQKLTYEERPTMIWRNNKVYKIKDGFLVPEEKGEYSSYKPFDLYESKSNDLRYSGSPHQIFADVDISDNESIEDFYCKFGPLGFYDRDVIKLITYNPTRSNFKFPSGLPIAAVLRNRVNSNSNSELLPLEDLKKKFHIPDEKFREKNINDVLFEIPDINSFDTWESLKSFKEAHEEFNWIMNLNSNLENKNAENLKKLLLLSKYPLIEDDIKGATDEQIFRQAATYIYFSINIRLKETVSVSLSFAPTKDPKKDPILNLSRDIVWRCKSLISAMWLMLLLDITKSKFNAKCAECGKWFYAKRSHGLYCGTNNNICKYRANKRNQKYKSESLKKDTVMNLLSQGSSKQAICKSEGIRKKTIEKWINENVEA
ncbi:MAG TPA: hypothetical protein VIK86_06220 [Candidatus Paceibacterota bacterium]